MAARPEPWFWTARKAWYVQIGKRQIPLGKDKDQAYREFYRLMAESGSLNDLELRTATFPDVAEAFLASKSKLRDSTIKAYTYHLSPIAKAFKGRRAGSIKAPEITRAVDSQPGWGDSTKHTAFNLVGQVFDFARDFGYLDRSPMVGQENPWLAGRREQGVSLDEFARMIAAVRDQEFRLVLRFLRDVGPRPQEMIRLEARHLHPTMPIAVLGPHEHKTGRRSGRNRVLVLPEHLMVELRKLAVTHPEGPLLRNTQGNPWTQNAICMRFRLLREKLGLPGHVIPYGGRHGFSTRLVTSEGVNLAIAARVVGHANTNTIQSVYFHPEHQAMIDAVQKLADQVTSSDT